MFSPCSKRAIFEKLYSLLSNFPKSSIFSSFCKKCGNGYVDIGEQCDEAGDNLCCNENCTLKTNATCSPHNHDCCRVDNSCQIADTEQICRSDDSQYCRAEVRCDGIMNYCPISSNQQQPLKPNGVACRGAGEKSDSNATGVCKDGFCQSSCPDRYTECDDDQCHHVCRICCKLLFTNLDDKTLEEGIVEQFQYGKCEPMLNKADGTPCQYNETMVGQCSAGWCSIVQYPSAFVPASNSTDTDSNDKSKSWLPENWFAIAIGKLFFFIFSLFSLYFSFYLVLICVVIAFVILILVRILRFTYTRTHFFSNQFHFDSAHGYKQAAQDDSNDGENQTNSHQSKNGKINEINRNNTNTNNNDCVKKI